MKKYELTDNYDYCQGRKVFQIRALRRVRDGVYPGDFGGWIESEDNLSQEGDCWVEGDAVIFDNALVCENAFIRGRAIIGDDARVHGDADISDCALVCQNAEVYGNAIVTGYAQVRGNAKIYENARVKDKAQVFGNAEIFGSAGVLDHVWVENGRIYDYALIDEHAWICGTHAEIHGSAHIQGNAWIFGDAKVYDRVEMSGNVRICTGKTSDDYVEICGRTKIIGNENISEPARISCDEDVLCINAIGDTALTFFKTENGIVVNYGRVGSDFIDSNSISIDKFEEEMDRLHHGERKEEYALAVKLAKLRLLSESDEAK